MLRIIFTNLFIISAPLIAMETKESDGDTMNDEETIIDEDSDGLTEEYNSDDEEHEEDESGAAPIPLDFASLDRELIFVGSIRNTIWTKLGPIKSDLETAHNALRYPICTNDTLIPRRPTAAFGAVYLKGELGEFNHLHCSVLRNYARSLIDDGIFIYESAEFTPDFLNLSLQFFYEKTDFMLVMNDWRNVFKAAGFSAIEIDKRYKNDKVYIKIMARKFATDQDEKCIQK